MTKPDTEKEMEVKEVMKVKEEMGSLIPIQEMRTNHVFFCVVTDKQMLSKLAKEHGEYFICNSDVVVSAGVHTGNPLPSYLSIKKQEWEKVLGRVATISDKNKWLCYCKPFLFKILRGVSRGLTIVYDNNLHFEGGLSVFVTPEGDGKLQLFGKAIEIDNSALGVKLEEVRQMVSTVIGYPFNLIDVETDPGFQFSSEDMFLFDILHEHNL